MVRFLSFEKYYSVLYPYWSSFCFVFIIYGKLNYDVNIFDSFSKLVINTMYLFHKLSYLHSVIQLNLQCISGDRTPCPYHQQEYHLATQNTLRCSHRMWGPGKVTGKYCIYSWDWEVFVYSNLTHESLLKLGSRKTDCVESSLRAEGS